MQKDWLKILQIATLVVVGCLVVEYAFWLAWKPKPILIASGAALTGYFSLLWAIFKGSPQGWLQAGFQSAFRLILSTLRRALATLAICGIAAGVFGFLLVNQWRKEQTDAAIKEKQPNFLVQIYRGNPIHPAVGAVVTVNDPIESNRWEEPTDSQGYARFRLISGNLRQISIAIEQDSLRRQTLLPVERSTILPDSKEVDLDKISESGWKDTFVFASARTVDVSDIKSTSDSRMFGESQFLRVHLPWGEPQASLVISRRHYAVGFDPVRRLPRWVAYKMKLSDTRYQRQPDQFVPDPLIPPDIQASQEAYAKNPYDKGQLVSRHDVSGYGENPQFVVSYMSVVAPQIDKLNRVVWTDLEEYCRGIGENDDVWIIAGPAFIPPPGNSKISYPVLGDSVAVPTHFFRILIRKTRDSVIEAQTFLVPNSADVEKGLEQYLSSIDKVESVTGVNLFSLLSEQEQRRIKSTVSTELW